QCGEIPTIAFLKNFPKLHDVGFRHTSVCDGDLSVATQLPRLKVVEFVPYKKHYRPAQELVERGVQRGLMDIKLPEYLLPIARGQVTMSKVPEQCADKISKQYARIGSDRVKHKRCFFIRMHPDLVLAGVTKDVVRRAWGHPLN